jgi:DTW domain-containing protein YfiP
MRRCFVVFPGSEAVNLNRDGKGLLEDTAKDGKRLCLFVIDGTWSQAKAILRRSPRLGALPRISFDPTDASRYRIRRQPREYCLSTVESVHRVIQILEPTEQANVLLRLFDRMIDDQITRAEAARMPPAFRTRMDRPPRIEPSDTGF